MSDTTNIKFLCPHCHKPFDDYTQMSQHSYSCPNQYHGFSGDSISITDAITGAAGTSMDDMKWSIVEGLIKRVEELERKLKELSDESTRGV